MTARNSPKFALVTGGCGFVGRHLTRRLLAEEYSVWIIDNLSTGLTPDRWLPPHYQATHDTKNIIRYRNGRREVVFIHADTITFFNNQLQADSSAASPALPAFDAIFHLASVVGGRAVIEGNPITVAIDLAIDSVFFRWLTANKHAVGHTLYASSSAVYPVHLQTNEQAVALKEDMIDFSGNIGMPDMTYGWSKLTGEYLCRLAAERHGISIACVRPFSGYGGDQDLAYPIPAIAHRAAKHEDPLTIWGTGQQGRDFIHIDDCIEAMLRSITVITDGSAVNIGSGTVTTIKEAAAIIAELNNYRPVIKPLSHKPAGVQLRHCDPARARDLLEWQPTIPLREGLRRVVEEQQKNRAESLRQTAYAQSME